MNPKLLIFDGLWFFMQISADCISQVIIPAALTLLEYGKNREAMAGDAMGLRRGWVGSKKYLT